MKLELLPNEILLDLFDYFDGTDLLRVFFGLNIRFNSLLYQKMQSYYFQFKSISKRDFDWICQQHLPFIANKVFALELSNEKDTPEQLNLFLVYVPSFKPFIHIQSLTINHVSSYQILLTLLDECQHLCNLTRLKLLYWSFQDFPFDLKLISNKIWSLPKLTNCHLGPGTTDIYHFSLPNIVSTSIETLVLSFDRFQWNEIYQLIEYTPRLNCFSVGMDSRPMSNAKIFTLSTLIKCNLNMKLGSNIPAMNILFQNMPNLHHLSVNIGSEIINGHQWEYIIRNYLPKLKTFRVSMREYILPWKRNGQGKMDKIFESFSTPFWINEHKWFVRCYIENSAIHLSSRFNLDSHFTDIFLDSWRSTYPNDSQQEFYNEIRRVSTKMIATQTNMSSIRLPNIEYLHIEFPIDDHFWSMFPNLNRVKSIRVSSYVDKFQSQLQTLLNRLPCLHKLSIKPVSSLPFPKSLFEDIHASVCQLDLYNFTHKFSDEQCLQLARSPLAVYCEVLSICVSNRQSIVHLVKSTPKLRSMIVRCADDEYDRHTVSNQGFDELIRWLKQHLPSTSLVVRSAEHDKNILIWY